MKCINYVNCDVSLLTCSRIPDGGATSSYLLIIEPSPGPLQYGAENGSLGQRHWYSITGEMLRKGEMIDEVGKRLKIHCRESLHVLLFRASSHPFNPMDLTFLPSLQSYPSSNDFMFNTSGPSVRSLNFVFLKIG